MSHEPTLYAVIADVVGDGVNDDVDALTMAVFDKIGLPDRWRPLFHPIVSWHVSKRLRQIVRSRGEHDDNVTPLRPGLPDRQAQHSSAITRPQFLRDTIETFGSWGRVAFGAMTVEMHESRIAGQLRLAAGVKRDIDRHADAIQRIKASKVACLNDLPEYGGKGSAA